MKAYTFHDKHDCRLENKQRPIINENEVLVEVKASGVCGTDIHINEGDFKAKEGLILGHEFSGVVYEVGDKVKNFSLGDRVVGDPMTPCFECDYCKSGQINYCVELPGIGVNKDGSFAEYIAVPSSNVYKISKSLSFEEAAFAEPLSCCIRGTDLLNIKFGESVIIIGDGPVGLLFVQLAKLLGATDVVLVGKKDKRKKLAEKFGASKFIYGNTKNTMEDIINYFNGRQIDNVIEAIGKPKTIELAFEIATFGTKILLFGVSSPDDEIKVKPQKIFEKEIKIMGSLMNPYTINRAIKLIENKDVEVKSLITHRFNINDIGKAFEVYKNDKSKIKIMINF